MPIDEMTSRVIELDDVIVVKLPVFNIIENSCSYFGSSYSGRFEGTKKLLGYNYKAPIIVEESNELIFFPTSSPRYSECSWINLKLIHDYQRKNRHSLVNFGYNNIIEFPISFESMENQVLRATRLESVLRKRKQKNG